MAKQVKVTAKLLKEIRSDQEATAANLAEFIGGISTDMDDYARAAKLLAKRFNRLNAAQVEKILNKRGALIEHYACDGICNTIYRLKCEAVLFTDDGLN